MLEFLVDNMATKSDLQELKIDMNEVKDRLRTNEYKIDELTHTVSDMYDELRPLSRAFDKDTAKLHAHDVAIASLDTRVATVENLLHV